MEDPGGDPQACCWTRIRISPVNVRSSSFTFLSIFCTYQDPLRPLSECWIPSSLSLLNRFQYEAAGLSCCGQSWATVPIETPRVAMLEISNHSTCTFSCP